MDNLKQYLIGGGVVLALGVIAMLFMKSAWQGEQEQKDLMECEKRIAEAPVKRDTLWRVDTVRREIFVRGRVETGPPAAVRDSCDCTPYLEPFSGEIPIDSNSGVSVTAYPKSRSFDYEARIGPVLDRIATITDTRQVEMPPLSPSKLWVNAFAGWQRNPATGLSLGYGTVGFGAMIAYQQPPTYFVQLHFDP